MPKAAPFGAVFFKFTIYGSQLFSLLAVSTLGGGVVAEGEPPSVAIFEKIA